MNGDTTSHKIEQDESAVDDVLDEYDFSKAKPGRHRGFKGKLIRVLGDDTEQVIKLERDDHSTKPD